MCVALAVVALISVAATIMLWMKYSQAKSQLALQKEVFASKEGEQTAMRESLKSEFAILAMKLLDEKKSSLSKTNADSVQMLFNDLKGKLDKYEAELKQSAEKNVDMGVQMKTHVESLRKFSEETKSFIDVLKGSNRIQGKLGEDILESILAKSELKKGENYDTQFADMAAGTRPDAIIYDRNHHAIIIDAKMNIADLVAAYNMPDDPEHRVEKERAMREHAKSVRQQIDNLARKEYASNVTPKEGYENLPLVAMFCPFNSILEAALEADPGLMQYAYEHNIVIVTPITLWGYLWLVSWGWKRYETERRYDDIQKLGGAVIKAVDALMGDLTDMGSALDKAGSAYASLYKRMTEDKGQMSVKRAAQSLLDYGVAAKGAPKHLKSQSQENLI